MSTISSVPCDAWIRHYTSNRIGELELGAILRSLIEQGVVLQADSASNPSKNELKDANSHDTDSYAGEEERINHSTDKSHESACKLLWADFPEAPSAPRRRHSDDDASAGLRDVEPGLGRPGLVGALTRIVDAISATALPGLQPTGKYISAETYCMDSDSEEGTFWRHHDRWEPPYKQACHTMHSDCRRKHTYSITIEDTQIMLWYFSRSHFARSSAYSFVDVRSVVHALSALIFSTPEELGYDKNITRIVETDQKSPHRRYVYRVGDRYFKTLRCLYEYDSLAIAGRATRAWEVIEVRDFSRLAPLPNAQSMVLRDVWIDGSACTESEIQKQIFACCDELGANFPADDDPRLSGVDEPTRQELRRRLEDGTYKDHFLSIEADERGAMSKSVAEGFIMEQDVFAPPGSVDKGVSRTGADRSRASDSKREYEPRQRNFVVYKEVCCALHDLKDLHDTIQALLDCLWAVQILFLIGWIHRDISSGNVLFYTGRGILGDLEYAKKFDPSVRGHSDPQTGTPFFMAVELQTGNPIYSLPESFSQGDPSTQEPSSPAVRHNFQHDMESFFWILLWVSVTRIPGGQATANALFNMSDPYFFTARHSVILDPSGKLNEALRGLSPDVPVDLSNVLRYMRWVLKSGYNERKHAFEAMETDAPVYGFFRQQLTTLVNNVPPGRVPLQ